MTLRARLLPLYRIGLNGRGKRQKATSHHSIGGPPLLKEGFELQCCPNKRESFGAASLAELFEQDLRHLDADERLLLS